MKLSRRQKGIGIILFFILVIILSWTGLSLMYPQSNALRYLPDRIYRIIKILLGGDPSASGLEPDNVPWQLIVVKVFSVLILIVGVYKIIEKLFYEQFTLFRTALKKRHLVIVGIGDKGTRLLTNYRKNRHQTAVAIEADEEAANKRAVRKEGHLLIFGDARNKKTLGEAGIRRASNLICFLSDEQAVIAIAQTVRGIYKKGHIANQLHCYLHIPNPELTELIRSSGACAPDSNTGLQFHFFNVHKMVARKFFYQLAIDFSATLQKTDPHFRISILGFGDYAQAILLQALRVFHVPGNTVNINIYVENAADAHRVFEDRYPMAAKIFPVQFIEFDNRVRPLSDEAGSTKSHIVISAFDDSERNMNLGLRLYGANAFSKVYVLNTKAIEVNQLLNTSGDNGRLQFFGSLDDFCNVELITGEKQDALARAIHEDYLKQLSGASSESAAYTTSWEALSEDARDANRAQADHLWYKMIIAGKKENNGALQFSPQQVEAMAITEHFRWMAHRYLNGWDFGEQRDDKQLLHPSLVPWEALSESEKQKDRETVLRIPILIKNAKDLEL